MGVRSAFGSLQLPVAIFGLALVGVAVGGVLMMPSAPPESEGFVTGLAFIGLYILGWVGFVLLAGGLAIPPGDGTGIAFTSYQRGLFVLAAIAGVLSAFGPFIVFGLLLSRPALIGTAWVVLMGVAVTALIVGLLWRVGEAFRSWSGPGGRRPENS